MKRQRITPASLTSPATNSHLKGLQQYHTPPEWAQALGAALPQHRRTILDPFCGNGSLLKGLANDTTRDILGLDIDPTTTLGPPKAWKGHPAEAALRHCSHGDFLDLLPLLHDTATRFDLLALNPPFSLSWPAELLPESIRAKAKTLSSTIATLRLTPSLLTPTGEAILIANADTIDSHREKFPDDFEHVWLHFTLPSFYPGTSPALRIAALYFSGTPVPEEYRFIHSAQVPCSTDTVATVLDGLRSHLFKNPCIQNSWDASRDSAPGFLACAEEMTRRRDPHNSAANVTLDSTGKIRTWVSAYQERSGNVPSHLAEFLRKINRSHPLELTIQNALRLALTEAISSGIWTIDPNARAAIDSALESFARDRAPLAPVSHIQRLGWIDDTETLLCTRDFHEFSAGSRYRISSRTVDWKKEVKRPRYHAGKRDTETVLTKGTDLRITLHSDTSARHFTYNPENLGSLNSGRNAQIGSHWHTLAELADHFEIPEVPDITSIHPDRFAANLTLIDQLEANTP